AIPGEILTFDLNLISRSQIPVTVQKIVLLTKEDNPQRQLPADSLVNFHFQLEIPKDTKPTEPYWLSTPQKSTSQYAVESAEQVGLPFQKPDLNAKILLTIGEQEFWVHVPFSYKKLDPIKGDVVEQLQIRSEEHTSELQSRENLVCRLLL